MRKLIALFILVSALAFAAAPTPVQVKYAAATGNASPTTAAMNITAGNFVAISVLNQSCPTGNTVTVTSSAGDTITPVGYITGGSADECAWWGYIKNAPARTGVTYTATWTGNWYSKIEVWELSGADTVNPQGPNVGGTVASGGAITSPQFSTTRDAIVLAFAGGHVNGTTSAGTIGGQAATIPTGIGAKNVEYVRFTGQQSNITASATSTITGRLVMHVFAVYGPGTGNPLVAGSISEVSKTSTTANLSATAATGGTTPYAVQWYRDTMDGFTPSDANDIPGATALTLADAGPLTPSTTYYYKVKYTDSASAVVYSAQYALTTAPASLAAGTILRTSHTSTTVTLSATDAAEGNPPYSYQWYRSTSAGFTPGAGNILTGRTALTFTDTGLSPNTTYYYVLRYTDSQSATADATFTELTTQITAGIISKTSETSSSVSLVSTAATGGTPPYTYQWHVSPSNGFTPSGSTAITGATALSLTDVNLVQSATYYYKLVSTDSAGASVTSAQFTEVVPAGITICMVGDGITTGVNTTVAPGAAMLSMLKKTRIVTDNFQVINMGVVATTSADWVDGSTALTNAIMMCPGSFTAMVNLGLNDAKDAVATSQATYQANLASTIAGLRAQGYKRIILNYPIYVNTNSGGWTAAAANSRITYYHGAIRNLAAADPSHVYVGDDLAYQWFGTHTDELQASSPYPTDEGNRSLAYLWAQGYRKLFLRDYQQFLFF